MGDAHSWADQAKGYPGWKVSDQPTVGAIVVFQPSVQYADPTYGHVAIVKEIQSGGNLITSNMNVINHPFGSVVDLTNQVGPGVSFITNG
jgi:surface antigen